MSTRQEIVDVDGVPHILIRSRHVIELHTMDHRLVERRISSADEAAEHERWESETRGPRPRLSRADAKAIRERGARRAP